MTSNAFVLLSNYQSFRIGHSTLIISAKGDKHTDGIILDPPKYGRGPKGEFWRIENHLTPLLQKCRQLLSEDALLMVLTIYAIRASSLAAHYALADLFEEMGGSLESGELALQESPLANKEPKSAKGRAATTKIPKILREPSDRDSFTRTGLSQCTG